MAELLSILAKALLLVLARVDKKKQKELIVGFYTRLDADPCQLLVEQLHTGAGSPDTTSTAAQKCKGD